MFEIQPQDALAYRRATRRSTLVIALLFAVLAVLSSTVLVALLGAPGGDNFRFNLAGVLLALCVMIVLVRGVFWTQPWLQSAVYGWRLKRSLMRVSNVMHVLKPAVERREPAAMKLLRFYHLGLLHMHLLDGNTGAHEQALVEHQAHAQAMAALAMDTDQYRLDPQWLEAVKQAL